MINNIYDLSQDSQEQILMQSSLQVKSQFISWKLPKGDRFSLNPTNCMSPAGGGCGGEGRVAVSNRTGYHRMQDRDHGAEIPAMECGLDEALYSALNDCDSYLDPHSAFGKHPLDKKLSLVNDS